MKKILLFFCSISAVFFLSTSCAIHGEKYRLQSRMSGLYAILDNSEEELFAARDITKLGEILDQKEAADESFAQKLRDLRINEAVMSFDGTQTVHFFYYILLKDLAKFSYNEFLSVLKSDEQILFVQTTNFVNVPFTNKDLKKIFENARNDYYMKNFSDVQILNYYRNISLPSTMYVLVYDFLTLLARYRLMEDYLAGDIESAELLFERIAKLSKSTKISIRKQAERDLKSWNLLKERSLLTKISDFEFLTLMRKNILPEMDPDVRVRTIDNIRNRFKEQK